MSLTDSLLRALDALNITTPTPVQTEVIPKALVGGDWMVSSQTGSGKTFAFLLPVLNRMMLQPAAPAKHPCSPDTLVLCPTRELAQQVSQDAINLVKFHKGLRIALVVGGMPYQKQMASLTGARVVVGTPGRLLDLCRSGKLQLSNVQSLIVDEADRMLDLGFSDDLKALSDLCGKRTQTLMFSATFAKHVENLASNLTNNPTKISISAENISNTDIAQSLFWADNAGHKRQILSHWLEQPEVNQAVIFTSTQKDAEKLASDLDEKGHNTCALHGAMPQVVRNRRLNSIRKGTIKILVATDVAARGLDVPNISHVFNYGMPMKAEDYVHRIGRTGRAGRSGVAVTLASADERSKINEIQRLLKVTIPVNTIPGLEPTQSMTDMTNKKRGSSRRKPHSNSAPANRSFDKPGRFKERSSEFKTNDRSSGFGGKERTSRFDSKERSSGFGGKERASRFDSKERNSGFGEKERASRFDSKERSSGFGAKSRPSTFGNKAPSANTAKAPLRNSTGRAQFERKRAV